MSCCGHCADSEALFNRRAAEHDLRRYRRRGMRSTTRMLVDSLRPLATDASLLDIGGGVGAVQHELFASGLDRATHVDASTAYLERSAEEARRRGHASRVTYLHGDFVDIAARVDSADLVALDRVICCYPDVAALVTRSVEKARRAYAVVYPRDRRLTRLAIRLANTWFRARRSEFRVFVHPPALVDRLVRSHGFVPRIQRRTAIWKVVAYERVVEPSPPGD